MVKVRANALCLVGVVIGFISIVSVWRFAFFSSPATSYDFSYAEIQTGFSISGDALGQLQDLSLTTFHLGVLLAVIGIFLGMITPMGGVLELVGAILFLSVTPTEEFLGGIHGWYYYLRIGPFIALISGSLMILSMILPMVMRRKVSFKELRGLPWTFAIIRRSDSSDPSSDRALDLGLASWIPIRSNRSRMIVAILIMSVMLVASIGISLNDSYSKPSAKIAVHVIADTTDHAEFTLLVDGYASTISSKEVLRNYYVEAGEYTVTLTLITPWSTVSSSKIRLIPLQEVVITFYVTDTTLEVSKT